MIAFELPIVLFEAGHSGNCLRVALLSYFPCVRFSRDSAAGRLLKRKRRKRHHHACIASLCL
jgi:hypothetical protein